MCPVCLASMGLVAAGAISTGGLTALIMAKLRAGVGLGDAARRLLNKWRESRWN
jgi:hypothetical protein